MTRRKRRTVPTLGIRADIAADKYTADLMTLYYGPASGPYKPGRHPMWCGYFAGYLAGWRAAKQERK